MLVPCHLAALALVACTGAPDPGPGDAASAVDACATEGCAAPCPRDQSRCGTVCVDTRSDPAHCGGCDRACDEGTECRSGACQCPEGLIDCDGSCVDPESDDANCGLCGRSCGSNESCSLGSCVCGERVCVGDERCLESGSCGCTSGTRVECSCGAVICCSVPDRCVERCDYHCG